PGVRAVAAEFRHFVECERPLDGAARQVLGRLLDYGIPAQNAGGELLLVVPRLGTISPWSSKATDIARNCGLQGVRRIERGTVFFVDGVKDRDSIIPLLHDRMTETVLRSFDAAPQLFEHVPPRKVEVVSIDDLKKEN